MEAEKPEVSFLLAVCLNAFLMTLSLLLLLVELFP